MEWIKNIFKRKPKEYYYFKKVTYKFHGLCGTKTSYTKIEAEKGSYSQLFNCLTIKHANDKGFKLITEPEYLVNYKGIR